MRFSIRDLMWLTTVVALTLGWVVTRWQLVEAKLDAEIWEHLAHHFRNEFRELEPEIRAPEVLPTTHASATNPPKP
jgi:hypothetical protein